MTAAIADPPAVSSVGWSQAAAGAGRLMAFEVRLGRVGYRANGQQANPALAVDLDLPHVAALFCL